MPAGWGDASILRWLRVVSVLAFLGLIVIVVVDPARAANVPLVALLAGAILLQLGYEVVLPGITDRRNGGTGVPPNGRERRRR